MPPIATLLALAVATILAQAVRWRPVVKSAFNVGQLLVAAGLGLVVSRFLATPTRSLRPAEVGAAIVGVIVYFCVNTAFISGIMVSMGASWRQALFDDLHIQSSLAAVGALVGATLAWRSRPTCGRWPSSVPVVIVVRRVITDRFRAQIDRARMKGLFDVALEANRRLRSEAVAQTVMDSARQLLRCQSAALTSVPPGPTEMSTGFEVDGRRQWLVVSGRRREEPFDLADRILLDAVGAIGKGALTNAELYREVRYERERLASITHNMGEGVCAVDASGRLTFVNPAAAEMVNLPTLSVGVGDRFADDAAMAPDFLMHPAYEAMHTGRLVREDDAASRAATRAPSRSPIRCPP